MARISDAINQGLENLSTSPLGMASLGLLMQPSMSRTPINPFAYAAQGMQMGLQNRALKQEALAQQERARSQEEARRARLLMDVQRYQQEEMKMRMAQQEQARQAQAMQELMSTLSPEEARLAAVLGPKFAEQMMQQRGQTGRLPAANIQEYEAAKAGGFQGSFMDYLSFKNTRPVSPHFQAIPTEKGIQTFDTRTGQIVSTQGLPPAQYSPSLQGKIAEAKEEGKGAAQGRQAAREKAPVLGAINYLAQQFLGDPSTNTPGAIDKLYSGGFMGLKSMAAPIIDKADRDNFESLQRQLSTQLRAIFRIPGEGTLSDKEQADNNLMLPSVQYDPSTNKTIMNNLLEIINIRAAQAPENNAFPSDSQVTQYPRGTVRERGK